jgi:death on curing protein
MIDVRQIIAIHEILIKRFGGSKGIRDMNGLESAIYRPFHTFDQKELYPAIVQKSAALFESLIINHPFIDGNKRTAYVAMRLFLLQNNLDVHCTEDEKYLFVIKASQGKIKFKEIHQWLESNIISIS